MTFRIPFAVLTLAGWAMAQTPTPQAVTLAQAVQEAIEHNLDLAAERLNIPVAQALEITARLRPNPVLTLSGQTLNVLGANFSPATPLGPNQMNIHTDFPFERGGKRTERIAVARETRSLAELGVREVMRQLIANVQNAFVDVQQARENVKLAEENLRNLEGVVKINEARVASGDLSVVELDRSRVAALQSRTTVQQTRLQLDQAKTQLRQLMGRAGGTADLEVEGELRRDGAPESPEQILRVALTQRPDYLLDKQTQARSQADLRLQLANGKVDFSVGTEFTRQTAWGVSGNSMGVYFSVPLPVFNRNQGEIARAQREIGLAGSRAVARARAIQAEVERAYRQYTVSKQLLTNIESEMLRKARSVRDTTEYSYRRGEASLVEFLDAQRAFNDANQTYNEARANYARSLYLIDSVSGMTTSGK